MTAYCKGWPCTKEDDDSLCCMTGYTCNSSACPVNWIHKPDAENIICEGEKCVDSDFDHCCQIRATCDTYECPASEGYVPRVPASLDYCLDAECTSLDNDICCLPRELCTEMKCPSSKALRPEEGLLCKNFTCEPEADTETCCMDRMKCELHSCPSGWNWKEDTTGKFCQKGECAAGELDIGGNPSLDDLTCCDKLGTCAEPDYSCPQGFVVKEGAENILCQERFCEDKNDRLTCCDSRASCKSKADLCPPGWQTVPGEEVLCEGKECSSIDIEKCCMKTTTSTTTTTTSEEGEEEETQEEEEVETTTTVGLDDEEEEEEENKKGYACRIHGLATPLATLLHSSLLVIMLRSAASALSAVAH